MISYICGKIDSKYNNKVTIDNNNIAFDIFMSHNDINNLPDIGKETKIHTYMNVREDDISLYGFLNREDKDLFIKLLDVNGVGPKGALNIIGFLGSDALMKAIGNKDVDIIASVQGIGKKTASKICIELSDKVGSKLLTDENTIIREEVVAALIKLGYNEKKAREKVKNVDIKDGMVAGDILKQVL